MKTIVNGIPITCNETIDFFEIEYIRNINGQLVLVNQKKTNLILHGFMEVFNYEYEKTYRIEPKTLITSEKSIELEGYNLIDRVNESYIYRLNLECKLISMQVKNYECIYRFEEV